MRHEACGQHMGSMRQPPLPSALQLVTLEVNGLYGGAHVEALNMSALFGDTDIEDMQ